MYAFSLITYKFEKTTCKIMMSIKPSTKTVKFKALLYSRNVFNLSTVEEDIFSKCMIMMLMKLPPKILKFTAPCSEIQAFGRSQYDNIVEVCYIGIRRCSSLLPQQGR